MKCLYCGAWLEEDPHYENCPVITGEVKMIDEWEFAYYRQLETEALDRAYREDYPALPQDKEE